MALKRWVLIPIMTEREAGAGFLKQLGDAAKIVLVYVVDKEEMGDVPAGFAGSKIKIAEEIMDKIKSNLPDTIQVKDYIEWGTWLQKIENISKLEQVDEVVLVLDKRTKKFAEKLRERGIRLKLLAAPVA